LLRFKAVQRETSPCQSRSEDEKIGRFVGREAG